MMERDSFLERMASNLVFGARQFAPALASQQRGDERREQGGSKLSHSKTERKSHGNEFGKTVEKPPKRASRGQGCQKIKKKGQTTVTSL